jgi:hypothetical protein
MSQEIARTSNFAYVGFFGPDYSEEEVWRQNRRDFCESCLVHRSHVVGVAKNGDGHRYVLTKCSCGFVQKVVRQIE